MHLFHFLIMMKSKLYWSAVVSNWPNIFEERIMLTAHRYWCLSSLGSHNVIVHIFCTLLDHFYVIAFFADWSPFLSICLILGFCKCSVLLKLNINTFPSSFDVFVIYHLLTICCQIWTSEVTVLSSWEKGQLSLFCILADNPYVLYWVKLMCWHLGSFPSQIFNLRGQIVSRRNSPLWEFF